MNGTASTGTGLFTKTNINKFFTAPAGTYTPGQKALLNTFSEGYLKVAAEVFEKNPVGLVETIISDMVGSYSKNVGLIVHGWAGNA